MATATETNGKATKAPKRGFDGIPCILCGAEDNLRVDLDDMAHFTCSDCDGEFTAQDVRRHQERWTGVLAWLDAAPPIAK